MGSALFNAFFHDFYGERSFAGWENFQYILGDRGFGFSLTITVLWSVFHVTLTLLLGFFFAVKLSRLNISSSLFYLVLLVPWGIPIYIAVPLWRALIHGSGGNSLLTTLFGLRFNLLTDPLTGFFAALLVSIWVALPITTFVLLGAIRKIPGQLAEAARIDGARDSRIALAIYLPVIRETLLVMGILNFIKAFKEFTVIFLMTSGGPPLIGGFTSRHIIGATTTLEIFLYEVFTTSDDLGIPAAFAVVMAVLVVLIMGFWLIARGERSVRGQTAIKALAAVSQLVLAGPWGLPWAAAYLASIRWAGILPWILGSQALAMILRVSLQGVLAGFNPGIFLGLIAFLYCRKKRTGFSLSGVLPASIHRMGEIVTPVLMSAVTLLLLYIVGWMSLSKLSSSYVDSPLPLFPTLGNFRRIVVEENILRYFGNTLVISLTTGILIPLVSFPAAYYLSHQSRRFSGSFLTFVQIVGITGGMHSLIPLYSLFRALGMLNSYPPLVLVYLAHAAAFALFTMKSYLDSVPDSLRENAEIEGMSAPAYILKVLLPLSLPVISTAIMVAFLSAWNGFLAPLLLLSDDSKYTISVKLYTLVGGLASRSTRWNLFAAASLINVAFIAVLFLPFRRPVQRTGLFDYGEGD
jgi:ABC-type glycerol-3-phosphate transport system permease component